MAQLPFAVIPLDLGTITTGNEASGFNASHLNEFLDIGMTWKSSGASNLWVRGDFGAARSIDYAGILSANAQAGTTIRLRLGDSQAEVDGTADYDSTALPFISPSITREDGLYHSHHELPSLQSKRWWRIDIAGHSGDFQAAKLILGQKAQAARFYSSGFEFGVEDLGDISYTRWGVSEITDGLKFRTLNFKLVWVSEAEYEQKWRPLAEKLGKRKPALWCFDPTANSYRQARTYFGTIKDNPFAIGGELAPATYSKEFSILSMI